MSDYGYVLDEETMKLGLGKDEDVRSSEASNFFFKFKNKLIFNCFTKKFLDFLFN